MTDTAVATPTKTRFVLLTQDNCPNCERLKLMLDKPLKGQFNDQIELVHREERSSDFEALVSEFGVQSTPALIDRERGEVLRNTGGLGEVKNFLSV